MKIKGICKLLVFILTDELNWCTIPDLMVPLLWDVTLKITNVNLVVLGYIIWKL